MNDKPIEKVIQSAMTVKMQDEIHHHHELKQSRDMKKKRLGKIHHPRTKTYKKIIQYLRLEAEEAKKILGERYRQKIEHIEKRYRDTEENKMAAPQSMEEYGHLRVFSTERYAEIQEDKTEVPRIGEIHLTEEGESILRRHPKYAIVQNLEEDTIREEMEKAYSIMRMQLKDEDTEEYDIRNREGDKIHENRTEEDKIRIEKEDAARARQTYDPIEEHL